MPRFTRVIAVTIGLIAAGAIFGAAAGAVALAVAVALTEPISNVTDFGTLAFAAYFGALIGAAAAPTAGWLLLRRVPLGRAIAITTAGAVTGGIAGWLVAVALRSRFGGPLPLLGDEVGFGLVGAGLGFATAAVIVRRRGSRHTEQTGRSDQPAV
jgi:hypothetical protein